MIIKCPNCDNTFLAPDDLEEGQTLKCGNCENSWKLKQESVEIPHDIKPTSSNHITDFKAIEHKEALPIKSLFIAIVLAVILIAGVIGIDKSMTKELKSSTKIFSLLKSDLTSPKEEFQFKNLRAIEKGNLVYLTGEIQNISPKVKKVPSIIVNGIIFRREDKEKIAPMQSSDIKIPLSKHTKDPIEISF